MSLIRLPLKTHQVESLKYALKNNYCILALDPGLGKSRVAIEVANQTKDKCLIICPSYLISNWIKELRLWSNCPESEIKAFRSGKDFSKAIGQDFQYAITSYDLIQKCESLFTWAKMLVLDEAHAIKSMKAKRSQFIHRCTFEYSMPKVLLLSGTPIKNRVQEFYSLLALCHYDPKLKNSDFLDRFQSEIDFADYFSYRKEYSLPVGNRYITILKFSGIRNTEELKSYLEGRYIRIKSKDVLDLPPISYKESLISDNPDQSLIEAFEKFADSDGGDSVMPNVKAEAALKKAPFTVAYAKDLLEQTECLLIYSDHVLAAEYIAEELKTEAVTGKMPTTRRAQIAKEFQDGERNIIVATIKSLSEGVDLTRSSHIVFNDYPWVPGDLKQVIYRIQRIGQTSPCTIHKIMGSPQDDAIMRTIQSKLETIEKAT